MDGSFRPDNVISRAEMAVMIAKALNLTIAADAATSFSDNWVIQSWAKGAIAALKKLSIMGGKGGKGGNAFDPNSKATRAEVASVLMKMLAQKGE